MLDLTGIWVIWRPGWPINSPVSSFKVVGYVKYYNLHSSLQIKKLDILFKDAGNVVIVIFVI